MQRWKSKRIGAWCLLMGDLLWVHRPSGEEGAKTSTLCANWIGCNLLAYSTVVPEAK
jgi:hypothetical protein